MILSTYRFQGTGGLLYLCKCAQMPLGFRRCPELGSEFSAHRYFVTVRALKAVHPSQQTHDRRGQLFNRVGGQL